MAFRIYLVPLVVDAAGPFPGRRVPKYFAGTTKQISGGDWSLVDYGNEPWAFVGADLSSADDVALVAEPDAFALPFDLSLTLTAGQVAAAQTKLESANIPAGWVTTALTWVQLLRTVVGMCRLLQRLATVYARQTSTAVPSLFGGGLSVTFSTLPAAVRQALLATAAELNISTAGMTGGTTLRVMLKAVADELQDRPLVFAGRTI